MRLVWVFHVGFGANFSTFRLTDGVDFDVAKATAISQICSNSFVTKGHCCFGNVSDDFMAVSTLNGPKCCSHLYSFTVLR